MGLVRVKRFFRRQGMRPQAAKLDQVYMALLNNQLVAALRLCPFDDAWVLRSMCVESSLRGEGIGGEMLSLLASVFEATQCYCFAYDHLEGFYRRAGFRLVDVEDAPLLVAEKFRQYCTSGKKICLMQYAGD